MAVVTVNTDIINSPAAAEYFSRADRRVLTGLRTALEMLSIPYPAYAVKLPTGRPPARSIVAAHAADTRSKPSTPTYRPHKPASPERVAAAKARQAERTGISRPEPAPPAHTLYNEVFGG